MGRWQQWLTQEADGREEAGLVRRLVPRESDWGLVDLAGNDYLGLSGHPRVRAAAAEAATTWGAGAGASRLVTGTTRLHADLERELADLTGHDSALAFSTGYHANLGAVAALGGRDALLICDAHIHASLIDAARLSRAEVSVVPHQDVAAVRRHLADAGDRRVLVLAESIYSVLGDAAPLPDLVDAVTEHDALLLVDEAHGLGVVGPGGRGLLAEHDLAGHPQVVATATLSKSLGAQGGAVLGSPALVDHLVNRARPFIFDTGLAPASTAGALEALRLLRESPDLPTAIHRRVGELAQRLDVLPASGAVLSIPMTSPDAGIAARTRCAERGVAVGCFRPPSVPDGVTRLRVTCSAGLPEVDWQRAVDVVVEVVEAVRLPARPA